MIEIVLTSGEIEAPVNEYTPQLTRNTDKKIKDIIFIEFFMY